MFRCPRRARHVIRSPAGPDTYATFSGGHEQYAGLKPSQSYAAVEGEHEQYAGLVIKQSSPALETFGGFDGNGGAPIEL